MEVKDIITVIGTLFSIAVSIKTLFSNSSKPAINIQGNDNSARITNKKTTTNYSKTTNKIIIPPKNSISDSNSIENDITTVFFNSAICIIAIVLILTFNTYIVMTLSIVIAVSLLYNILRIKRYKLTSREVSFIVVEHIILSIIVLSALHVPEQLDNLINQFEPFNFDGFSLFTGWLIDSGKIIWSSLNMDGIFNVGIVLLLRIFATIALTIIVLKSFLKKPFTKKIQRLRDNSRSNYGSLGFNYFLLLLFLHSAFFYYPLQELLSPIAKKVTDNITAWFNR